MTVELARVLDDRYVLDELVGSGGMADVYRATDRVLGRQVAVKILRETSEGPHRARFADEARTLALLNHPGLITLLDAGFEGDHPYLVMELAAGPTLSAVIAEGRLDPVEVSRIGSALAGALDYAHRAGVVHRDVKPSNVLLCEDGRVLLADFGIARLLGSTDGHTLPGEAIGSPAYLAPEQVAGEELTAAVDVFALGLVLLEALTGVRAYQGPPIEAAMARLSASPEIPPSLGEDWCALITAMTARDPATRPTAGQVEARLGPVVHEDRTAVATAPLPVREAPEETRPIALVARRRSPVGLALLAGLVVLAVVLALLLAVRASGGPSAPTAGRGDGWSDAVRGIHRSGRAALTTFALGARAALADARDEAAPVVGKASSKPGKATPPGKAKHKPKKPKKPKGKKGAGRR